MRDARATGRRLATSVGIVTGRLPALAVLAVVACQVDGDGGFPGVSGGATVTATVTASTTVGTDASSSGAGSSEGTSAGSSDGSSGSGGVQTEGTTGADSSGGGSTGEGSGTSAGGTPLDPLLDVPNGGRMCQNPGDLQECPGIAVCRFATVEYGLCESCDACGNLGAPCVEGTDCDILFECYAGSCTNFCTLGTFECGPVEACLDIGHPTRGVCDPAA